MLRRPRQDRGTANVDPAPGARSNVIGESVDYRNRLTHMLNLLERDEEHESPIMLIHKIVLLLKACLLKGIGFGQDEIRAALVRNEEDRGAEQYGT
jgi:hypothetical protein